MTPPSYRFDIAIEADLIEEVARIVGFEAIPETRRAGAAALPRACPRSTPPKRAVLRSARGARLPGGDHARVRRSGAAGAAVSRIARRSRSSNPIASDLSVMRVSLWPGLLRAALENQRRQQDRIRLFEHGTRFDVDRRRHARDRHARRRRLRGRACPSSGASPRTMRAPADFYDVKGDLEALLACDRRRARRSRSRPASLPLCIRAARRACCGAARAVGWLGELHPTLVQGARLYISTGAVRAGLCCDSAVQAAPRTAEISRFPQVRRDLAVVVDEVGHFKCLRRACNLGGIKPPAQISAFSTSIAARASKKVEKVSL